MPTDNKAPTPKRRSAAVAGRVGRLLPGVLLCVTVALICFGLEGLERRQFEHPYVEALVMAILLGMIIRAFWTPAKRWQHGIAFSAKQLLEVAVMLLGASISFAMITASGSLFSASSWRPS